jgi:predicted hydrocarbon binding protein
MQPLFEQAETYVSQLFSTLVRRPEKGTVHVGDERYVIMRADSLFLAWFTALEQTFGAEIAREFIYNTAREIGRADSVAFAKKLGLTDPVAKLSCGPVHFAHAGWAFVDILDDSAPAPNEEYFIHYYHPNTFESEVLRARGAKPDKCACMFSAGYSAGWCSEAFGVELHGREVRCVARGEDNCEFIMACADRLDGHEHRLRATWTNG